MIYFAVLIFDYNTDKVFMPGSSPVGGVRVSFHAGKIIEALLNSLFHHLGNGGGIEGQGLSVEHSRSSRLGQG